MAESIDILLATFNGERYLRQQLDSIFGQTNSSWSLLIRDDASTDGTSAIIEQYRHLYPGKISVLAQRENLGSCQNFGILLQESTAQYAMFCDQDDVWLPNKVALTFERMQCLEKEFTCNTPLLVYTDLKVVSENLETAYADSAWRYQHLDPRNGQKLNRLLLHNIPTGCTMMINRALRELANPIPPEALMHDWWIALSAAAFGQSSFLTEPTMLYRQHWNNTIGAKSWSLLRETGKHLSPSYREAVSVQRNELLNRYRSQAQAFLHRFTGRLSGKNEVLVRTFAEMGSYSVLRQKYYILRHRFFYSDSFVTAAMILFRW